MLRPFKFQILPVALEVDGDKIIGERTVFADGKPNEAITIYGVENLVAWAEAFEESLAAAVER